MKNNYDGSQTTRATDRSEGKGNTDVSKSAYKGRKGRRPSSRNNGNNKRNGTGYNNSDTSGAVKHSNDESWYLRNPELTQTSTAFNMLYPTGVPFNLLDDAGSVGGTLAKMYDTEIPGVCVLKYIPTIGYAINASDPVNVAATKIYAFVRHMNSGHTNYESADLMLYLLQMRQVYSWYMWMARLYGVLNSYSNVNRNLPKALVKAMGCNYDDLISNMPQLLFYINSYCSKVNALSIPGNMKIFSRAAWMNGGIYYDSDISKAQCYMFQPDSYTTYNAAGTKGGELNQIKLGATALTYSDIVTISEAILGPVFTDEDMNIMSGDILKAYGDSCAKLSPIAANFTTYPVYLPEVLDQIHNARLVGEIPDNEYVQFDITQGNGLIKSTPVISSTDHTVRAGYMVGSLKNLLDFPDNSITDGRTLEASRFMITGYNTWSSSSSKVTLQLDSFGTEILTSMTLITMVNGVPSTTTTLQTLALADVVSFDWIHVFEHAPILHSIFLEGSDHFRISAIPMGELGNYTPVDRTQVYMLHQTALMSLFDI